MPHFPEQGRALYLYIGSRPVKASVFQEISGSCASASRAVARVRVGLRRGLSIEKNVPARDELVQQIEIADVACQHDASQLAGLQIEESVVQEFPLVALILWQFTQAENQSRKHAGRTPRVIFGGLEPMRWDILCDGFPKLSEGRLGLGVSRVQAPKGMGQFGK
jgi:hypothetical protein